MHATYACAASVFFWALAATAEPRGGGVSIADVPALSDDGLANLVAFTRAFGLVRFFHPSDEASSARWEELALTGIERLETARSSSELADGLRVLFEPVAPTARFQLATVPIPRLTAPAGAAQVVRWRHHGFGFGQRPELATIYYGTRERRAVAAQPADWVPPTRPIVFDLGRGVTLVLPVVLWADVDARTLPSRGAQPPRRRDVNSGQPVAAASERSERLAAVAIGWTAVRHFFPYFEDNGVDWDAHLTVALRRAATDWTKMDFLATLRRMMAALHDGHAAAFLDAAPAETTPTVALALVDGAPVVVKAWGDAAAALTPGSVVLAVDGEPVASRIALIAAQVSAATPGWRAACVAREILAGAPATNLTIIVRRPEGNVQQAVLHRPQSVDATTSDGSPATRELREGVWYVNLSRVAHPALEALYPRLAAAKAVVFDLRGYPRVEASFVQHLIDAPVMSARFEVPVITRPAPPAPEWDDMGRWSLAPAKPHIARRIAFLVGGGTISYGETLLDLIDANALGVTVGETSAGTNGTVIEMSLPGGFAIDWTGMRVRRTDGARLFGRGIAPAIRVAPTLAGLAAGRDEVLDRAVEAITR